MQQTSPRPTAFLTGVTGLVGHFLMLSLLERGYDLIVLARGNRRQSAEERVDRLMLEVYPSLEAYAPIKARITVVEGDLKDPSFGLSDADWAMATARSTTIAHCGALLLFTPESADEVMETNLNGAMTAHRFAREAGLKTLHHVSTAYLVGAVQGEMEEAWVEEEPTFNNTYERSKWLAETRLRALDKEHGLSTTVYRPSCIIGAYKDGRTLTFRTLYGYIDLFDQERRRLVKAEGPEGPSRHRMIYMLEIEGDRTRNIVPTDYVADAMAHVMTHPEHHGGVYHLTNPSPPSRWESNRWMVKGLGFKDLLLPSVAAAEPCDDCLSVSDGRAARFEQLFKGYLVEQEPIFLTDRIDAALAGSGISCPDTGEAYIGRVVDYCVSTRWRVDVNKKVNLILA